MANKGSRSKGRGSEPSAAASAGGFDAPQGASEAIAEDARSLAALHDRELTQEMIAALRETEFPAGLGLAPASADATAAWRAMAREIASLPPTTPQLLDELAAEYAAIYLTCAIGASPCESYWTDDDHLICQDAMFSLRDIYAAAGLVATDWRQRADDHLVLQLLFVAHAAENASDHVHWRSLATMLDEHILRWIGNFAVRVANRSNAPFYAELAVLTAAWLETLRDLIARMLDEPRPTAEEIEERLHPDRPVVEQPVAFMPGSNGPSW